MMQFDVAIVGAGAVGNMTAYLLAKKGYKVVVLEKKESIGKKVCAGLVSGRVIKMADSETVMNEIKGALINFPDGRKVAIGGNKTFAYVIDRKKFDQYLAEKAMSEGVEYKLRFRVKNIYENKINGSVRFRWLIGADGARSIVAEKFSFGKVNYVNAIQGEGKRGDDDFVEIYFGNEFAPGFFAWIVPDGNKLRIGLGSKEGGIRKKFNTFVSMLDIEVKNIRGAVIPIGLRKFAKKNVALVGDAAGQVKATSGGGLYAGLLASKILAENFDDLTRYEKEYMKEFGNELKKCLILRKIFYHATDKLYNYFGKIIEKDIGLLNEYGDIDYQSVIAKQFIRRHPLLAISMLFKCLCYI